jgi:hypothetical protein
MYQLAEAVALPPGPLTVTMKRCAPTDRLLTCHGDEQGTNAALSSEQRVLVTVPLATQVNWAVRDVVKRAAPDVSATRGAAVVGGGGAVVTVQL